MTDRFLIVEVPGADRGVATILLEKAWLRPHQSTTVEPGPAARDACSAPDPPLACLVAFGPDFELGLDAVAELRRARRSVPVIALLARADEGEGLRALAVGAHDFVTSGDSPETVARALRYAVERQASINSTLDREALYRALIDTMVEGIVVRDASGRVVAANPAAERMTGLSRDEMNAQGWPPGYLVTLADGTPIDPTATPGQSVVVTGVPVEDLTLVMHFPDGTTKHVLVNIRPVYRDDEDRPVASVASLRDVSELRAARQASEDSEARFEALVQNSSDGIVIVDGTGTIIYCNPGMERIFGKPPSEYIGRSALDLMHEDEQAQGRDRFVQNIAIPGSTGTGHYRGQHADGSWRWLEVALQNRIDDPAVGGIVANFRDITERKEAEEEVTARLAQTAAVAALGQRALGGTPLPDLMAGAVNVVASNLGGRSAILLADPGGTAFALKALSGTDQRNVGSLRIEVDRARPTGLAFLTREPIVVADRARDPRFRPRELDGDDSSLSAAYVVLEGPAGPAGVLTLHSLDHREFTESDVHFMQAVGNVVASAIERQAQVDDIRHQALHDSLTGLPNRVLFLDRLEQALGRAGRRSSQVAVLFLDLDRFKVINDSLGHSAGDRVLVSVAERLRSAVRPGDTVARLGGDEFAVLCEDVDRVDDVVALAQRISQSLSGPLGDHGFHVTASVGIAVGSRDDDAESLVRDSDAAMYRAKEKGRDRCEVFDDDTRVRAVRRLELENELRVAMDQGELRIHVQPILSVSSQKPVGAEALVRWDHPRLGLIPPAEFVSLAEETGLVGRLGRWMLDQACHAAQQWRSSGLGDGPLSVSVNLSARQLAQIGLTDEVASALERSGLPPELLCLEITESAVMEDVELSIAVLRSLKNLGVRLSIDDFGTGYSSLSYLKRFPVDELKVDRSFIDGLGHEAHDSSIVSAVVGLAHNLGVKAVAEGVETSLQLAELIELGCDYAQGFLWFRPDDLAGFERWIDGAASDS